MTHGDAAGKPPCHRRDSPRYRRAWVTLRRKSVPKLVRTLVPRHPEFARVIGWAEFKTICDREGIRLRISVLPPAFNARLVRLGQHPYIQINRALSHMERTFYGMHELCHYFRDDPGVPAYYADADGVGESEEFADIFAWYCTSPARDALGDAWLHD